MGERGWSGVEEGEWRLSGDFGSREFSMREWKDNRVERAREGGEWDLRGGEVGGRVSMSDIGDSIASMLETGKEEDVDSCCCDQVTHVKILITMLALINLALVVTGCVGISITVLEHWREQHLFTPVMVSIILITTIFSSQTNPATHSHVQNSSERRLKYQFQLKKRLMLGLFSNKSSHLTTNPTRHPSSHPSTLVVKGDLSGALHKRLLVLCIKTNFRLGLDNEFVTILRLL